MSAWLRYWYPGLRWTPPTLTTPARVAADLATVAEEQRALAALLDETCAALAAVEARLAALERWRQAEAEIWGP